MIRSKCKMTPHVQFQQYHNFEVINTQRIVVSWMYNK